MRSGTADTIELVDFYQRNNNGLVLESSKIAGGKEITAEKREPRGVRHFQIRGDTRGGN